MFYVIFLNVMFLVRCLCDVTESLCYRMYGCVMNLEQPCVARQKGLQRVWRLLYYTRSDLSPELCCALLLKDEMCHRFIRFLG
jgi:hypothetical protein